jgi:hypothetical protein
VVKTTIPEELRETLEQVAALCPLRASFINESPTVEGAEDCEREPCSLDAFDIAAEAKGLGYSFACRHSQSGICAGYVAARAAALHGQMA